MADGRTDTASRFIAATPETVYGAFTDAEAIAVWLPPKGMTGRVEHFDPRPGGAYRMALIYDDPANATGKSSQDTDIVEARFVELLENERVVWAVDFESDDPAFSGTMTMTWHLTPTASGTEVTVRAENVPYGIKAEDHQTGLNSTLENLAAHCE